MLITTKSHLYALNKLDCLAMTETSALVGELQKVLSLTKWGI